MNNQSTTNQGKKPAINIEHDIDETLTINDIKKDLSKCKRMITRSENKIKLYSQKLHQLNNTSPKHKSLIQKGLEIFNLTGKIKRKV